MKNKRKILAVTGARSEYDILSPVLEKIKSYEGLEVEVLITGSHLSENFGKTANNIMKDGYKVADRIYNLINTDEKIGRVISLGNQIPAFAHAFARVKPDIILVVGDREEAITTTLTGAYLDIPVAHIAGGDIAKDGNIDNSVRYAASKFAHIHFTILEKHKKTLIKLGEDEWRIFNFGNPALDKFINTPLLTKRELSHYIGFDIENDDYIVLIQHPIITDYEKESFNIRQTLDAIVETNRKCLINYPNSDAGNHAIIEAYQEYSKKYKQLFLFKNLERISFVNLLKNASCLVGNSSSGLIEAPSVGLPVVNVGSRQRGRAHALNVVFVDNNKEQISDALKNALYNKEYIKQVNECKNPYGDGKSAEKIVNVLATIAINKDLVYKNITY